ncbi:MBL fold metallo-hydrolase [Prevotella aurantiaca]
MKLTYIFHSGFAIETETSVLIFDYWRDPARVVSKLLSTSKPVYVFASHFHEDHFTREILTWRSTYPTLSITYILSKDILKRRRAVKEDADVWLAKGGEWHDNNVKVYATGSNDSDVSWIVEVDGNCIFHAGDLNNWYARFVTEDYKGGTIFSEEFGDVNPMQDEKRFLGELKDIKKISDTFDVVMFPIDGRIGNGYTRGARQFIKRFNVGLFIPMHFVVSGFESAWRMKEFTDECNIPFWSIANEGDVIEL